MARIGTIVTDLSPDSFVLHVHSIRTLHSIVAVVSLERWQKKTNILIILHENDVWCIDGRE